MPKKHSITLYEVENKGQYHEHWLASSALDAAGRAIAHAKECGLKLDRVHVSSMVQPEDSRKGGLVYVVNGTRTYAIKHGRVKRALSAARAASDPRKGHRGRHKQPKQKG